ncbi:phosphoglycerate mutase-like protein [Rickenella mellea]|uniref:Phytase A n=1 Tax=Rickenella mellea TaxID=50990 RepID=A0A4R5XG65_9AGAM|nr:phosphoglycerate mutase-like protein [Rickenella mellea]
MATLLLLVFVALSSLTGAKNPVVHPTTPSLGVSSRLQHSWAQYSPFFAPNPYTPPAKHCKITQVNIIERHGARFPTASAGAQIEASLAKLQAVPKYTDPSLNFLKNFTYDLGHDDLVPFGAAQSFDAGQLVFVRYEKLVQNALPFVRASSSQRVVDSANNWTAGVAFASNQKSQPFLSVILNEALNDTLDDNMCPNAGSSTAQTNTWQVIYAAPAVARLNAAAPGANLTVTDITNLISLCPFETVAKEKPSAFCSLFTQEEFDGFEYFGDLGKYYGTGYGQELGPVQGVGYINELLARLTGRPVVDHTQTNSTLDADPSTFPLNRTVYADFSHDNQMIAIYAAMGLFQPSTPLDPAHPDSKRSWLASQLVPFSATMVTERLDCGGKGREFVRVLVDDALQDLAFCGAGDDGMCSLDAFVQSQGYARNDGNGDFERCFA